MAVDVCATNGIIAKGESMNELSFLDEVVIFDIPSQGISSALILFGEQANITVLIDSNVRSGDTGGLTGEYSIESGIEKLLSGSNLVHEIEERAIIVRPQELKTPLAQTITASSGRSGKSSGGKIAKALSAFAAILMGGTATAGESVPADTSADRVLEEVVVTARKRSETLREIPATVDVFQADDLFERGLDDFGDLRGVIPNFQFTTDLSTRSRVTIRGLGSDRSGIQPPGVGLYVDGVYQNSTSTLNFPLFNVQRVEVLKGPQGTLYGRNAYAGVINIITEQPSNVFKADVQAEAASQDSYTGGLSLSGPLVEDQLFGLISVAHVETDGHYTHDVTGEDITAKDSDQITGRLLFEPTDALSLDLFATYREHEGPAFAFTLVNDLDDLEEDFRLNEPQMAELKSEELTLITKYAFDTFEVESNTALYDAEDSFIVDADVTPLDFFHVDQTTDREVFSQELRVQSTNSTRLEWLVGINYTHEEIDEFRKTTLTGIGDFFNSAKAENDILAGFIDVTYLLTDDLELGLGVRVDDMDLEVVSTDISAAMSLSAKENFTKTQPKITLTYEATDDMSLYATAAKGIRQGGFNRQSLTTPFGLFETDEMWNYEVGVKAEFPDAGAHAALSLFYIDADPVTVEGLLATDAGGLTNGAITAGEAKSVGAELNGGIELNQYMEFTGSLGILDCEYRKVDDSFTLPGIRNGGQCLDSSDWTTNLNLVANVPVGQGRTLFGMVSVAGRGDTRIGSDPVFRTEQQIQDAYWLLDAHVGLDFGNWSIMLFGSNLTDKDYAVDSFPARRLTDLGIPATESAVILGDERTVGLRARWGL